MVRSGAHDRPAEKKCSCIVQDLTTISVGCAHGYRLASDVGPDGRARQRRWGCS